MLWPVELVLGFAVKELIVGIDGAAASPTHPVSDMAKAAKAAHRNAIFTGGMTGGFI
jgi:hypothetical protein